MSCTPMVWTRLNLFERRSVTSFVRWNCRDNTCFQQYRFRQPWTKPARSFSITAIRKDVDKHPDDQPAHQGPLKDSRRKPPFASRTPLRRSANEAERLRDAAYQESRKKNKPGFGTNAKVVTAYCVAEQFSMNTVASALREAGHHIDPAWTGLYPQVVHVRVPSNVADDKNDAQNIGDVFVFPSGTVVAWNVDETAVMKLVSKTLLAAAENLHMNRLETEDFEFTEDPTSHVSSIIGDTINLGTSGRAPKEAEQSAASTQHETDLALVRIAFSSGLARSVKLAVLESTLESYFKSTRSIPGLLSGGTRLPFTRSFILRKTGELLNARAQLNLNNELTDSLPDMFWDSRHDLGLEGYFDRVGKALDVNVRSRVLNQKMDYAQEIVTVLREQLSEKHGLALEWLIIILIAIEVAFEILRLWREKLESKDPESTESLMRRFLQKELGEGE